MNWSEIAIVGGGCYGTFYSRQLLRAKAEGKAGYQRLLVVDRDPACRAARELGEAEDRIMVLSDWDTFFDRFLAPSRRAAMKDSVAAGSRRTAPEGRSVAEPPSCPDAIVPSPLMPHLMYGWLLRQARDRWPARPVETRPLGLGPGTPYDGAARDGTRYLSFADWICPTHCIEPAVCPATRGPRTWEMGDAVADLAGRLGAAGPVLFTCRHQVYGVGMFSVSEVLAGDGLVQQAGNPGTAVDVLVGTISACHGAVNLLHLGPG